MRNTFLAALTVRGGRVFLVFDASREALVLTVENGFLSARRSESIETRVAGSRSTGLLSSGSRPCSAALLRSHCAGS